jgi:hypothetical protein
MNIVVHAKEIADLIKKYNDQDLYERIVTLREEILVLREENLSLKEEVKCLQTNADTSDRLVREGNCYYYKDDEKREHPYCLACWDSDRKLVSLILSRSRGETRMRCNICAARIK